MQKNSKLRLFASKNPRKLETRKRAISIAIVALLLLSSLAILRTNATQPRVINDVWFVLVAAAGPTSENPSYTNGGTVLHNTANCTWLLYRSPATAGTVMIGTALSSMTMDFNNVTQQGSATLMLTLNFNETNSTKNPYGVGIINAAANVTITSLNPIWIHVPGNGTGTLTSTSGTGDFRYAVLTGDLVMSPFAAGPTIVEGLFFGTHPRVNGVGLLTFYPTLDASAFCNVTILRGETWMFFVQTLGGVAPYSFQWYAGNVAISGQTDMVLAITQTIAGTYTYNCRVTDAQGNVATTNTITLTVL
ncbi:MAG TPA: hypothetical protein VMD05_01680 [Candidatus Nanoarchaeia archaeon]|nr:hypothetical protein [Candidatus Nanoarchaeia archaeon]